MIILSTYQDIRNENSQMRVWFLIAFCLKWMDIDNANVNCTIICIKLLNDHFASLDLIDKVPEEEM